MNNDLISRSALLEQECFMDDDNGFRCSVVLSTDIRRAPAVDAVELVRCKDCIHSNAAGCSEGFTWCDKYDHGVTDDFYCKTGERRPDNAD